MMLPSSYDGGKKDERDASSLQHTIRQTEREFNWGTFSFLLKLNFRIDDGGSGRRRLEPKRRRVELARIEELANSLWMWQQMMMMITGGDAPAACHACFSTTFCRISFPVFLEFSNLWVCYLCRRNIHSVEFIQFFRCVSPFPSEGMMISIREEMGINIFALKSEQWKTDG